MKTFALLIPLSLSAGVFFSACSEKKLTGPTPSVTDVHKQDASDENPRIMWNQAATPVTVTGTRFTPMAINTLSDKAGVKIPELYLVNATSSTRLAKTVWLNRQTMTAEIPTGIAIADGKGWEDFQIVARDPAGIRGKPGAAFRVSTFQPPIVSGVIVTGSSTTQEFCTVGGVTPASFVITVSGEHFIAGAAVEFADSITASSGGVTATTTVVSETELQVVIPAGIEPGTYDVVVTNVDGQRITFPDAFTITFVTTGCPAITSVFPKFAFRDEDVMLQVNGTGFLPTPKLTLSGATFSVPISYEAFITTTAMQGFLFRDGGRPTGWYAMDLTHSSDGSTARLENAVLVLDEPIPRIDNVTPDSLALSSNPVVTITGAHFPFGATVAVVANDANGAPVYYAAVTQSVQGVGLIYAEMPLASINIDPTTKVAVFILRVYMDTDFGKVYGEYSNIVVTGSSGNTGPVASSASSLVTPRAQFGLVGGRNGIGTRFLYAVGGRTSLSSPATALDSVEIATIDAFGKLGDFYANPTTLGAKIYGLGLVELGGWLYATGGSSPTGVRTQILKAKILDPRTQAPEIVGVTAISGTLAAGNWLYRVSAVLNGADLQNPNGESLASFEVGQELEAAGGVRIRWKAVSNAVSYRIYRTPAATSVSGSQQLLAQTTSCCSYDDTGSVAIGSAKPLPQGALSVWTSAGTLNTARLLHGTAIARNNADLPFLYVLGGANNLGVSVGSYEYASASTTGGAVTMTGPLLDAGLARYNAGIAVASKTSVSSTYRNGRDWLAFYSGCDGANSPLSHARNAEVNPDGSLTGFQTDSNVKKGAGLGVLFTNDRLFQFGGSNGPNGCANLNSLNSGIDSGGLDLYTSTPLSWATPNANGTYGLVAERAYFGFTRFNAQIFMVGGVWVNPVGSITEVTNTIESVFY